MFNPETEVKALRLRLERKRGDKEEVSPWLNILNLPYWRKLYQIHVNHVKQRLLDDPPRSAKELLKGLEPVHA